MTAAPTTPTVPARPVTPPASDFWDDFTDREQAAMRRVLYHAEMVAAAIGDGRLGEVDEVSEHLFGELEVLGSVAVLFVQTFRECFGTPPDDSADVQPHRVVFARIPLPGPPAD